MPTFYSAPAARQEPQNRFYPPQGADTHNQPPIPGAPTPARTAPEQPAPARMQNQNTPMQQPPLQRQNQHVPGQQAPARVQNQNTPMQQPPLQRQNQHVPGQQAPAPMRNQTAPVQPRLQEPNSMPHRRSGNPMYFEQRHPIMLQRLYNATDILLASYGENEFIYDTYPDYLSLRLMRNRVLRDNPSLTEEFLQAGCPIEWLELLTDTITSELLCRRRLQK